MKKNYEDKIKNKEDEIKCFNELEGKQLFNRFSLEEKINNIRLNFTNKKKKRIKLSLSTNDNSINK